MRNSWLEEMSNWPNGAKVSPPRSSRLQCVAPKTLIETVNRRTVARAVADERARSEVYGIEPVT